MISKELMRLRKTELVELFENERQRADEQHDRAENLQEELDNIETYEDDYMKLEEVKDLIWRFKVARERYFFGVESEKETMEQLMEKLMEVE